jgi:hypothetical protein
MNVTRNRFSELEREYEVHNDFDLIKTIMTRVYDYISRHTHQSYNFVR